MAKFLGISEYQDPPSRPSFMGVYCAILGDQPSSITFHTDNGSQAIVLQFQRLTSGDGSPIKNN